MKKTNRITSVKIIGICGRAGAGKSTIVTIVKECFPHVQVVSTGDATRRILGQRGTEITHHNLQAITKEILAARGSDYISFIFEFIDPKFPVTLIDSFRRVEDVVCVTKTYGNPEIIAVSAPEKIRFQRLLSRARPSDALDHETFKDLTSLENSWGVEKIVSLANTEILNTSSLLELRERVKTSLGKILYAP